ncbi:hypothetical protein PLICRDRAFT_110007 [Plicaturopsis crispa FD-325 SS-3]|nr:hypothetical protein PLICRDRAFT_110007 [Plicaturopsis crispa FD-325 SS-3]
MKRKIIMHVGPTNSGKTHMALRALAAAESGVYAGPLRLLAHEIWERLNFGQIVPLGVDPEADAEPDTDSNIDVGPTSKQPTIQKRGNPKYARECNMLTGEETKIVSENSMLSCTVEMIPLGTMFDVAVVDEVQLLADPERGFAWTQAILGLSAKEIHLCGEEAAVPLVQAMMEETGDEVIVNRYQRLTPLTVQDQSLNGQLSQVRKGDCIVTFSRSGIFRLKKKVEELTGLRCAVAYGRLPPEIRSEQAALFNDPDSGYDVMIGSDAIGMGLNLKIKRVVFDSVHKWNGYEETVISNAQIKQIAGRAGRYGLHGDDASGGYVTTLEPKDLPILRAALAEPAGGLPAARVGFDSLEKLFDFLDPPVRTQLLLDAQLYTAHVRSIYRCAESSKMNIRSRFIDTLGNLLPRERSILLQAPIPWQDTNYLQYVAKLMRTYVNDTTVDLSRFLTTTGMMETLEDVEKGMVDDTWTQSSHETLGGLELLHKTIVLYMWLGQRSPLSFPDNEHVHDIKARTEKALDWCLQGIAWGKTPRFSHREVQAVRQRRDADGKISWVSKRDYRMKKEAEEHRPGASYPKHHKTAPSPSWAN